MDNIALVANMIFENGFRLLQIQIPWLGMTFLQLFMGIMVVNISIFIYHFIFDRQVPTKGGNNSNIKISDDRREDTK